MKFGPSGTNTSLLLTLAAIITLSGCAQDAGGPKVTLKDLDFNPNVTSNRPVFQVSCGSNVANVEYRITQPTQNTPKSQFALLLNGSSGTVYFADNGRAAKHFKANSDPYKKFVQKLAASGFRVMEVRYESNPKQCGSAGMVNGFYSACCAQGLDNVKLHNETLYDLAVQELGYHSENPNHKLVGFGWSLGATQVQSMAFSSGKKFEKVALTGVTAGDSYEGCVRAQDARRDNDGVSWKAFTKWADAVTKSTEGCSNPDKMEYTSDLHHFKNQPYRDHWDLGIFEGSELQPQKFGPKGTNWTIPGGLPDQANIIEEGRGPLGQRYTSKSFYEGCGHELLFCTDGQAAKHILRYLTR